MFFFVFVNFVSGLAEDRRSDVSLQSLLFKSFGSGHNKMKSPAVQGRCDARIFLCNCRPPSYLLALAPCPFQPTQIGLNSFFSLFCLILSLSQEQERERESALWRLKRYVNSPLWRIGHAERVERSRLSRNSASTMRLCTMGFTDAEDTFSRYVVSAYTVLSLSPSSRTCRAGVFSLAPERSLTRAI